MGNYRVLQGCMLGTPGKRSLLPLHLQEDNSHDDRDSPDIFYPLEEEAEGDNGLHDDHIEEIGPLR